MVLNIQEVSRMQRSDKVSLLRYPYVTSPVKFLWQKMSLNPPSVFLPLASTDQEAERALEMVFVWLPLLSNTCWVIEIRIVWRITLMAELSCFGTTKSARTETNRNNPNVYDDSILSKFYRLKRCITRKNPSFPGTDVSFGRLGSS